MAFNVVYSDKDRIQGAIESGVIPRESLVLTSDDAKRSEMYYYDDNGQLKTITKKPNLILWLEHEPGLVSMTISGK